LEALTTPPAGSPGAPAAPLGLGGTSIWTYLAALPLLSLVAAGAMAQTPRAAQPERPTVATHAWTVAPGYLEIETGAEYDRNPDGSSAFSTPSLLKVGLAPALQLDVQSALSRPPGEALAIGDLAIAMKYRVAGRLPLLGALAIQPGLKLPIADLRHGTGTVDGTVLVISSHTFGALSLDLNFGYTARSGHGSRVPTSATLWTAAAGFPVWGSFGWAVEVFGLPRTAGSAGAPGTIAALGGPTLALRPWLIIDVGGIVRLKGPQPDALYAGLVWNLGRL
jgi:Putative MetA-pathway of phenol degradation